MKRKKNRGQRVARLSVNARSNSQQSLKQVLKCCGNIALIGAAYQIYSVSVVPALGDDHSASAVDPEMLLAQVPDVGPSGCVALTGSSGCGALCTFSCTGCTIGCTASCTSYCTAGCTFACTSGCTGYIGGSGSGGGSSWFTFPRSNAYSGPGPVGRGGSAVRKPGPGFDAAADRFARQAAITPRTGAKKGGIFGIRANPDQPGLESRSFGKTGLLTGRSHSDTKTSGADRDRENQILHKRSGIGFDTPGIQPKFGPLNLGGKAAILKGAPKIESMPANVAGRVKAMPEKEARKFLNNWQRAEKLDRQERKVEQELKALQSKHRESPATGKPQPADEEEKLKREAAAIKAERDKRVKDMEQQLEKFAPKDL